MTRRWRFAPGACAAHVQAATVRAWGRRRQPRALREGAVGSEACGRKPAQTLRGFRRVRDADRAPSPAFGSAATSSFSHCLNTASLGESAIRGG